MGVTRWADTKASGADGSIVYDAGWTDIPDTFADGQHYRGCNANPGQRVTINVATASGFTGALLLCVMRADSSTAVTYTVDGGAAQTWNQDSVGLTTPVDGNYTQYRSCTLPINLVGNGAHTIIVTSAAGFSTFDGVDFFTAVPPNAANRYHGSGHSWLYAVTSGTNAAKVPTRFPLQIANYLGYAEDNYGNPAADLTNGAYQAGSPYFTSRLYNQQAHWIPDWMRAEANASWPASAATLNPADKGSQWLADAPYGPQWGARAPRRAAIMHGENDIGYETIYETAGFAIPAANRNAAATATVVNPLVAGTLLKIFVQRLREMIARMILEVPTIDAIDVFSLGNNSNGTASLAAPTGQRARWNAAIEAMCNESWIPAGKVMYVDILAAMSVGGGVAGPDNTHPSDYGHYLIFDAWRRAYEARHRAIAPGGVRR